MFNRRGKWVGKQSVNDDLMKSINHKNLICIKTEQSILQHNKFFTLATVNTRSMKGKDQDLHQYLTENNADICTVTETWLSDADADKLWLQTTDLNNNNCKFVPYIEAMEGMEELGIIYKSQLQMEPKCNGQTCSFEYGVWKVKAKKTTITVIAIYHLPYTAKSPSANAMFLDDFTNWLSQRLPDYKNVVITGDFNIHINNQDNDDDALIFLDMITATGLQIHKIPNT